MSSTAYNTASVIIPQGAGYKAGTLYGWRPDVNLLQGIDVVQNTANGSRVNEQGLIEFVPANTPRFDWGEGGSCPSLLVEPQRTNLLTYSEEFDNASWNKTRSNITANQSASPDGQITAELFKGNGSSTSNPILGSLFIFASSGTYTLSIYAKYINNQWIRIAPIAYTGSSGDAYFDILNGVVGQDNNGTAKIESFGNGWYRCSVVIEIDAGDLSGVLNFYLAETNGGNSYPSTTDQANAEAYIWGAQLEEGAYPTSYIKTEGSTATRNADVISKTGIASLIGQSEGTLYINAAPFSASDNGYFGLSDGTAANRVRFGFSNAGSIAAVSVVSSVVQVSTAAGTYLENTFYKLGFRYALNNYAVYENGSSIITDTTALTFSDGVLTNFVLADSVAGGIGSFYGRIRALAWWKTALTNSELEALTTP